MTFDVTEILAFCLENKLRFAAYSLPGSTEVNFVIDDGSKNESTHQFVMHPFDVETTSKVVKISAHCSCSSTSNITDETIDHLRTFPSIEIEDFSAEIYCESRDEYLEQLKKGLDKLEGGELDKFIYSRTIKQSKPDNFDLTNFLFRLIKTRVNTFTYLVQHENCGIWIGATPETLAKWENGLFHTMSLAGTQPKISDRIPTWSNKEKEEHNYVTKYIETIFSNLQIPVKTGVTETLDAGPVYHLLTPLESKNEIAFSEAQKLAFSLHPTPAVCGVPLQMAKNLIQSIENHNRSYYTGYVGIEKPGKELSLFVNLRCMQVLPNFLALYVGGGITDKSIPEDEWTETELKAKTLSDLIAPMS